MTLRFRLLGTFEVTDEQGPLLLGGEKQRRLLAHLALHAGTSVPVQALLESVWDEDPPASAIGTVQAYVSRLRALLSRDRSDRVITAVGGSYLLDVDPDAVDALRFVRLVREGQQHLAHGRHQRASTVLREALDLWDGPFLCGTGSSGALLEIQRRVDAARENALEARIDAELALGRHADLLPQLRERLAGRPLREAPYRQLMAALDQCGRQAEALAVYAQARRVLIEELGVEPGHDLRRLHERLLAEPDEVDPPTSNVPVPVNALVGRDAELSSLQRMLAEGRLVTVSGPGGSGKTRLAYEAARSMERPPDGTWLVELAGSEDRRAVNQAVARTLRVLEQPGRDLAETVAESLSRRDLLLVLDNCEHVVDACARLVDALLRFAPGVRVLATSREPLGVEGERVFRLLPLAVPEDGLSARELHGVAAVDLFVERAQAADPGFVLTDRNASAVAQVCRELDGLPLALELAAATLRAVDVGEVAARLPDRFAILTRGPRTAAARHRSLQAAVDWGYDLLDATERDVYQQLSSFASSFTLEAAEQVCVVETGSVLPVLADLVDKSFVSVEPAKDRFRLLETLRLHADGQLEACGRKEQVARRHALQVLHLTARAAAELRGPDQLSWVDRLDEERDDIAAALRWSLDAGDAEIALGLVSALWWYWWRNGHIPDGARWARQVLDRFPGPAGLRASALVGTAHLTWKLGEFDESEKLCDEALQLVQDHALPGPLAPAARGVLAMVARDRGQLQRARDLLQGVATDYAALGERWGEAATLNMIVSVDRDSSDHDHAIELLERSAVLFDGLGDLWGVAWSAWLTGRVETRRGNYGRAGQQLRHSIVLASDLRHGFGVVLGLAGVAGVSAAAGDHVAAARMLGATDALEQAMGFPVRAIEREDSSHDIAVTRTALGAAYDEHWTAGFQLAPEDAVREALTG